MKATLSFLTGLLVAVAIGCSTGQTAIDNLARNLTAAQCANQSATLQNLPLTFVTPAQAATILAGACDALYGTVAAPVTAPGNAPVFPGPTAAPSAAPSVSTAVKK